MTHAIESILQSPWFLIAWATLMIPSLIILIRDLIVKNSHLMSLMKVVWVLTVVYSGPLGLLIYWLTGRREIPTDSLGRRAFRSVAHCYSGCGLGEIVGVILAVGLLHLGNLWTSLITFALAYAIGFGLTLGPLVQDGVPLGKALRDTIVAETTSITAMELTAIGISLWLVGKAGMGDPIFWSGIIVSLTCGLLVAYPVNVLLIHFGIKEGMMDPRMTHEGMA